MKLEKYVKKVERTFDTKSIVDEEQNASAIKDYYLLTHFAYLLFHNTNGFMHMGISSTDKYSSKDLFEPLRIIESYINKTSKQKILELGAGNGSNSSFLAKRLPNTNFLALDLSTGCLNRFKQLKNFKQDIGDFHDLARFEDNSFDLLFVIEALCHSQRKAVVLSEAYKKLKSGGYFLIFDGYLSKNIDKLTAMEKTAKQLVEKSMAVEDFENIDDMRQTVKNSGFSVVEERDLSKNIMPSLRRFESLANIFYSSPILAGFFKLIFPIKVTQNSIAGLLMPTLIEDGIACYYLHILQKP